MEPNEVETNNAVTETTETDTPVEQQNQQIAQQVVEQKAEEESQEQQVVPEDEKVEEEPEKEKSTDNKREIMKHLVKSSNIEWVGYDERKKDMYVGFLNNTVYRYYNVPQNVFDELLNAGSKGRYFWAKIRRNNNYEYKRVK